MSEKDMTTADRDALRQLSAWLGHRQWYALSDQDLGRMLAALGRLLHGPADLEMAFRVDAPKPSEADELRAALAEALEGWAEERPCGYENVGPLGDGDKRIAELRAKHLGP